LAPEFTKIFLGEKWIPMVSAMRTLALAGLIRSIQATTGPVFQAVGKPEIDTKWQIVRLIVLVVSIYPLTLFWGILGASMSVCLSIFVIFIGCSFMVMNITGCEIKKFGRIVAFPSISGAIMMAAVFALKISINTVGLWTFFLLALAGIFAYLAATYLQDKFLHHGTQTLLKEILTSFH
jgi:lipopolysaccharide exporter